MLCFSIRICVMFGGLANPGAVREVVHLSFYSSIRHEPQMSLHGKPSPLGAAVSLCKSVNEKQL